MLPIKEIGKLLCKSQATEEVHENDMADDGPLKLKKEGDPFLSHNPIEFSVYSQYFTKQVQVSIQHVAYLPDYHIPDIPTPPPNC